MVGGACQSTSSIPPHTPQYIVYLDITTTYSGTTYSMLGTIEHMFEYSTICQCEWGVVYIVRY